MIKLKIYINNNWVVQNNLIITKTPKNNLKSYKTK